MKTHTFSVTELNTFLRDTSVVAHLFGLNIISISKLMPDVFAVKVKIQRKTYIYLFKFAQGKYTMEFCPAMSEFTKNKKSYTKRIT